MNNNYPIVRLQREVQKGKRIKSKTTPPFPAKIPYQRQIERLEEKFASASDALENITKGIDVAVDPRAVVPERALVFELIGKINGFEEAVQALGFEWLASEQLTDSQEENQSVDDNDIPPAQILYVTMPSLVSLGKLLAMWREYKGKKGTSPDASQRKLWDVFGYLRDLRVWSVKDRIDPSIRQYIEAVLAANQHSEVLVEFSFWYRSEEIRRDQSLKTLDEMLVAVGGTRLDFVEINEIGYQGALVKLPSTTAKKLADASGKLVELNDVMTIRPQSAYESHLEPTESPELGIIPPTSTVTGPCIAALLDGYPVDGHAALTNRLYIHEVDVTGAQTMVAGRHHGTAMASLVIHGDLHKTSPSISRKLAVVPVLTSNGVGGRETTPKGLLPIGVIYRALTTIVNADPTKHPDLAKVTLINHSLGDTFAPFVRRPSPWAALLDYFSHNHRLLFVISAGNIFTSFPVGDYANLAAFESANPIEREAAILNAIEKSKATRTILSPAESVNSLTVGAVHADEASNSFAATIDPYPSLAMTNLASAVGFGVNRSLKPDLVCPGGRFVAGVANVPGGGIKVFARPSVNVGNLAAAPSPTVGNLRHVSRIAGTSNAAALVTRAGVQIADALDVAYEAEADHWLDRPTRATILKALIAHGTRWGRIGEVLEDSFPPESRAQWSHRRDTIGKFLGYGSLQADRVVNGSDHRITLLADDEIMHDELHEYRIPIPSAMLSNKELRSITVTLAWTTPIVTTSSDYRGVAMKIVDANGSKKFWTGVQRSIFQPNGATAERGTLIHLTLNGKNLEKSQIRNGIFVGVQAMARHPSVSRSLVPYALAVTLEVAQSVKTAGLYAEVKQTINTRAKVRAPRVGARG